MTLSLKIDNRLDCKSVNLSLICETLNADRVFIENPLVIKLENPYMSFDSVYFPKATRYNDMPILYSVGEFLKNNEFEETKVCFNI